MRPDRARRQLAHGAGQGAARATSSTASTRTHGHEPAAVGEVIIGGDRDCVGHAPRCRRTRGRTSPRPTTARRCALYVNGVQVAHAGRRPARSRPRPAPLQIGGNTIWGEYFQGLIDEVRVYNRALTAARDPGRHEHARSRTRTRRRRPRRARSRRPAASSSAQLTLDGGDRQRRRRRATTSTARRRRASRRAPATGSRSRRARATPTRARGRAPTTTRSPPRTRPATSAPPRTRRARRSATRTPPSRARDADRDRRDRQGDAQLGRGDRQRRRRPLQRPPRDDAGLHAERRRTGSRSRPGRATPTRRRRRAPTTTRSPPRTRPATSAPPRTRRARRSRRTRRRRPRPPGSPAPVTGSTVNLSWSASTDNVGVVRYNVHRATTAGFTPSAGEPDRAADRHELRRHRARRRHLLLPGHRRGRGRQRQRRVERGAAATVADATPPTAPTGSRRRRLRQHDHAQLDRRDRQRRRRRATTSTAATTAGFTPSAANRIAQPTGTSYTDAGLAGGHLLLPGHRRDAAGNIGPASNRRPRRSRRRPTGLVAAYGFDEGSGTTTADQSGNGNTGTLVERDVVDGRQVRQRALFNGTNARVNVPDSSVARPHDRR